MNSTPNSMGAAQPGQWQWPEPRSFQIDIEAGALQGAGSRYEKRLRDLRGLYADDEAFDALVATRGDEVVYDVTDHRPSDHAGDLITGVTRMSPGRVGYEYFMTRGHIHGRVDRPELYVGLKGSGLMVMESVDGQTRIVEMAPMTACYVPPYWIHRSVNVGDDDFAMLFSYPADSGQDYEIIARSNGMKTRIVQDVLAIWKAEENAGYVPRSAQEVQRVLDVAMAAGSVQKLPGVAG